MPIDLISAFTKTSRVSNGSETQYDKTEEVNNNVDPRNNQEEFSQSSSSKMIDFQLCKLNNDLPETHTLCQKSDV